MTTATATRPFNRYSMYTGQTIKFRNRAEITSGWVKKPNPKNVVVEVEVIKHGVSTIVNYNVPYSLITEVGEYDRDRSRATAVTASTFDYATEGDVIEIITGSHKGEQYVVTNIGKTRYHGKPKGKSDDIRYTTIPFSIVKVVQRKADRTRARRDALTALGLSTIQVTEWEREYL